ncbi:hypothetical protein N2152v2_005224 [Parachlorella kessleri]
MAPKRIPTDSPKEQALLELVLNSAKKGDPESALQTIDNYCWSQSWMMHIGDVKGKVLEEAVAAAQPIKTAVELGTYCGYSALRIARLLPAGAKLVAIDPSEVPVKVAAPILEHAGLRDKVELIQDTAEEALPRLAQQGLSFDLVLIDHDKTLYLSDLLLLEKLGLLRKGTVVVAHNSHDYLNHVRTSGKYLSSKGYDATVEYNIEKPDAVEEKLPAVNVILGATRALCTGKRLQTP